MFKRRKFSLKKLESDILLKEESDDINISESDSLLSKYEFKSDVSSIKNICNYLSLDTEDFDAKLALEYILNQKNNGSLDYIMYSEISEAVFDLGGYERYCFEENIKALKDFAFKRNFNKDNEFCKRIILKIFDHSRLAMSQISAIENIVTENLSYTKEQIEETIKDGQKESITILGIFSSVVLTFVAGVVFSSSILENMHNLSVYKLVFAICSIALVLFNVIFILIKSIFNLNNKMFSMKKWCHIFNLICIFVIALDFLAWFSGLSEIKDDIFNFILSKITGLF